MDFVTALLIGASFFLIWIVINMIVAEREKRTKLNKWFPHEYYKSEKGWWKKW